MGLLWLQSSYDCISIPFCHSLQILYGQILKFKPGHTNRKWAVTCMLYFRSQVVTLIHGFWVRNVTALVTFTTLGNSVIASDSFRIGSNFGWFVTWYQIESVSVLFGSSFWFFHSLNRFWFRSHQFLDWVKFVLISGEFWIKIG